MIYTLSIIRLSVALVLAFFALIYFSLTRCHLTEVYNPVSETGALMFNCK
jgi:hypothetical protein